MKNFTAQSSKTDDHSVISDPSAYLGHSGNVSGHNDKTYAIDEYRHSLEDPEDFLDDEAWIIF